MLTLHVNTKYGKKIAAHFSISQQNSPLVLIQKGNLPLLDRRGGWEEVRKKQSLLVTWGQVRLSRVLFDFLEKQNPCGVQSQISDQMGHLKPPEKDKIMKQVLKTLVIRQ